MSHLEETIEGTLDANGQLRLAHQPQLPPGPVPAQHADERALP